MGPENGVYLHNYFDGKLVVNPWISGPDIGATLSLRQSPVLLRSDQHPRGPWSSMYCDKDLSMEHSKFPVDDSQTACFACGRNDQ